MKRNQEKERNDRLSFKTLDTQFKQESIEGLNCSPLEANALIDIVKEVYFPFLNEKSIENIRPGQIVVQAIDLNEPAGKPIKECKFKSIILTIDNGQSDLDIRLNNGIPALRREQDDDPVKGFESDLAPCLASLSTRLTNLSFTCSFFFWTLPFSSSMFSFSI